MELNQYEIILVNLDPTQGSEIKKTRPCVVLSPNEMNQSLKTVTIAPMTTQNHPFPTRLQVILQCKLGWVVLDQIRTIDQRRAIKKLGRLTEKEVKECKKIIREILVD